MTRLSHLKAEFVECMPETLHPGILYVSRRFSTASHLCCCGCGLEVVTPLNVAKWRLVEHDGSVSLQPSIGNWSFPCRSHYWIDHGRVRWAGAFNAKQIAAVQGRDRRDAMAERPARSGGLARVAETLRAAWAAIRNWWRR